MSKPYNDPDITPIGFLYAVMHDPDLPLKQRMTAANKLMRLIDPGPQPPDGEPTVIVRLNVPPEEMPKTEPKKQVPLFPTNERDLQWIERCKKYGIDPSRYFNVAQ